MTLTQLRQQLCHKRAKLNHKFRNQSANHITDVVISYSEFKQSSNIAAYIAVNGELDPALILEHAAREHKNCYLPVLTNKQDLMFAKYQPGDKLVNNRFNIPEPIHDNSPDKLIAPEQLDLVIVPLVAFDKNSNRIGMGCGYYDRTFAFRKQAPDSSKPFLLGIAYGFQEQKEIIPEPWDVQLDNIISITL
ncbi:MAG: 5-formyltetrahydrofolate cyclo-ligase [Gammaproteobacteria bacterium]|nr:5-formyltetrahydrofolate cyclo-ligase [Gammaproteobacteria bacterium]